jgi:hypothetical protein
LWAEDGDLIDVGDERAVAVLAIDVVEQPLVALPSELARDKWPEQQNSRQQSGDRS